MARPWFGGPADDGRADARDGRPPDPPKPDLADKFFAIGNPSIITEIEQKAAEYNEGYKLETLHQIAESLKK